MSFGALAAAPIGKPPAGYPEYVAPPKQQRILIDGLVPYERAAKPFTDAEGRVRVIVDFMDGAKDRYLDAARNAIEAFDPKRDRHHPQALLLLDEKSRQYGIKPQYRSNEQGQQERTGITTWVGMSISGYLTEKQIDALRRDEDVRLISEDRVGRFSQSEPLWTDSSVDGEMVDWGYQAVNGKQAPGNTGRIVWIIDSGVAYHSDLGSVTSRYNVASGAGANGYVPGVGCYAHATHVAGIVGATANNGQGRRGIYAGVEMRSINGGSAYNDQIPPYKPCAAGEALTADHIGVALDYVFWQSLGGNPWSAKPNVVNMSFNGGLTGFSSNGVALSNQQKMQALATPGYPFAGTGLWYLYTPGNVVVQSAGNDNGDSCVNNLITDFDGVNTLLASAAYKPAANASADPWDGVLVVGAIKSNGDRPAPFTGHPPTGGADPGSNYGSCVDLWAPGNSIFSTWGLGTFNTNAVDQYSGGIYLSGTSMAAPHVAAAAAYFIDAYGLTTPAAVEQTLRANSTLVSGRNMVWMP